MYPNNKLQLFRHFPVQQLLLRSPAHSPSAHTNNNAPSGPNTHFHAFSTSTPRGAGTSTHSHQHHTQHHTQHQHHARHQAAYTPSGRFPHLEFLCLWIKHPSAESYSQGQATHTPPSSLKCKNDRNPGCVAESLYLHQLFEWLRSPGKTGGDSETIQGTYNNRSHRTAIER